jgi:hypothetical protein
VRTTLRAGARWRATGRVAIAALALVVLAACADDDEDAGSTAPPAAVTGTDEPATTAVPPTGGSSTSVPTTTTTTAPAPTTTTRPVGLGAGAVAPGACDLAPLPAPPGDRPVYDVDLTVDPDDRTAAGMVTVAFTPDLATDRVVLRLWANGPRPAGAGGHLDVVEATIDGEPVTFSTQPGGAPDGAPGTILVLDEGTARPAGRRVTTTVSFTATLPGPVSDRLAVDGSTIRLGSFLPLLAWVRGVGWQTAPAVDLFAESVASEAADWDVVLSLPDDLDVLATGTEVEPRHFVATGARDWSATIGFLDRAEGTALDGAVVVAVGVGEGAGWDANHVRDVVVEAVDAFSARFGPYPWSHLTVAASPGLDGGIEFPGHIMLGDGASVSSLVHEVAHQWFYALVGNDQFADAWLDEGLTEWAESSQTGELGDRRAQPLPASADGALGADLGYWAGHRSDYFAGVYIQGLQLLEDLGDGLFAGQVALDCALATYVHDEAWAVATPEGFAASFQRATGVDPRPAMRDHGIDV